MVLDSSSEVERSAESPSLVGQLFSMWTHEGEQSDPLSTYLVDVVHVSPRSQRPTNRRRGKRTFLVAYAMLRWSWSAGGGRSSAGRTVALKWLHKQGSQASDSLCIVHSFWGPVQGLIYMVCVFYDVCLYQYFQQNVLS